LRSCSGPIFFIPWGWRCTYVFCTVYTILICSRSLVQCLKHCSPRLTYCPTPPTTRVLFRVISLTADNAADNILENIFPGTAGNAGESPYIIGPRRISSTPPFVYRACFSAGIASDTPPCVNIQYNTVATIMVYCLPMQLHISVLYQSILDRCVPTVCS
jgi:hypothetical protein